MHERPLNLLPHSAHPFNRHLPRSHPPFLVSLPRNIILVLQGYTHVPETVVRGRCGEHEREERPSLERSGHGEVVQVDDRCRMDFCGQR